MVTTSAPTTPTKVDPEIVAVVVLLLLLLLAVWQRTNDSKRWGADYF